MLNFIVGFSLFFGACLAWSSVSHFGECDTLIETAQDAKPTAKGELLLADCHASIPVIDSQPTTEPPLFRQSGSNDDARTTLRRVSDNQFFNTSNGQATHSYSRRQAWNSNETRLDIANKIVAADTLEIVVDELPLSSERVWSNTNPDWIYGLRFEQNVLNQFVRFDIAANAVDVLFTFDKQENCSIGRGEGTISNDESRVLVMCGSQENGSMLYSLDVSNERILANKIFEEYVNWAGFSQSATYIVVESKATDSEPKKLYRYSPLLSEKTLLSSYRHHGDFGVDNNGDDVFVMIGDRFISYVRLHDAKQVRSPVTGYLNKAGHGHVSCRNINRPGWCYVSTYKNVIGAVRIEESSNLLGLSVPDFKSARAVAAFEFWGTHESSSGSYASQPKVSASPSGKQVIFTSDWHGNQEINDYIISVEN